MKKITLLLLCIGCTIAIRASTNITTPTVSGHWTLAGSPYLVYNSITVAVDSSLTIDPGIEIVFQGPYYFGIFGILHASGSASHPINFTIQDTTGWYIDTASTGGWRGLSYAAYHSAIPDSSVLNYCNFRYMKNGYVGTTRSLHIQHCDFTNNKMCPSSVASSAAILSVFTIDTSVHVTVADCNFHDNVVTILSLIRIDNYSAGTTYMHNNNIHDNKISEYGGLLSGINAILRFDYNTVYNNGDSTTGGAFAIIDVTGDWIYFTGNKVYENVCQYRAPFYLRQGIVEIKGNYICNNRSLLIGTCGYAYGGGALFLQGTESDTITTNYIVSNNVIANNYSPYIGGGIYVVGSKVKITNNHIINNKAPKGSGIYMVSPSATIKNNIFYGNENNGLTSALSDDVHLNNISTPINLRYDHNWSTHPVYHGFQHLLGAVIYHLSDTLTNITGLTPGLVAPTLTANVTESALSADFSISSSSACINAGDTTHATTSAFDYGSNYRISGTAIDIGAYEYGAGLFPLYTHSYTIDEDKLILYPNPASNVLLVSLPETKGSLHIVDATGKQIIEKNVTGMLTTFDVHTLPRGIYVAVWNDGAGTIASKKIIVE